MSATKDVPRVILNLSAFLGPPLDQDAIAAFLGDHGPAPHWDEVTVYDAFERRVAYNEPLRLWRKWAADIAKTTLALENKSWIVVVGQAPGVLFALLAAQFSHPARSVTFVNPRFRNVLQVSDTIFEIPGTVEGFGMVTTKFGPYCPNEMPHFKTDVFVCYIGTDPRNTFEEVDFVKVVNEFCAAGSSDRMSLTATGISMNTKEKLQIGNEHLAALLVDIKHGLGGTTESREARTLILTCSSLDAVCYMCGAESIRTFNTYESVYFAERLSNGDYCLIPLRE